MKCRCCGKPMRRFAQGCKPARVNGEIVFTEVMALVDCQNTDCNLWMQTFSLDSYEALDLAPYMRGKDVKIYE